MNDCLLLKRKNKPTITLKMTKAILQKSIEEATVELLALVGKNCWNQVSTNCNYILSKCSSVDLWWKDELEWINQNKDKQPISQDELVSKLNQSLSDLYRIELAVYRAHSTMTTIELRYSLKSECEKRIYAVVKNSNPLLGCKLSIPEYWNPQSKFDVNWHFKGNGHRWKLFLYRTRKKIYDFFFVD